MTREKNHLHKLMLFLCLYFTVSAVFLPDAYASSDNTSRRLHVYAAITPLAHIIEQIGGSHLKVGTLLPPGQDPHLFEPNPRLLHSLSTADIYLMSGLPFERVLVKKISARQKQLSVIDLTLTIGLSGPDAHLTANDCLGDHDHHSSEQDPHFWLGTHQLRQFINAVSHSICDADPVNTSDYKKNTFRLLAQLDAVHIHNQMLLKPYKDRIFFVYHPAFGYFARTYGLRQHMVTADGRRPGPQSMATLIKQAREADINTIFVQPQYDTKSAKAIAAAIQGSLITLDPLAKDVIENLKIMAETIAQSFHQKPVQP